VPGADVETAADPELHWSCERELEPAWQDVGVLPGEHPQHLSGKRQRERGRKPEKPALALILRFAPRLVGSRVRSANDLRAVACPLDCFDQRPRVLAGRNAHPRPLGGEIDAGRHPGQAVEGFLDASGAGGAGHAVDAQLDDFLFRATGGAHLVGSLFPCGRGLG